MQLARELKKVNRCLQCVLAFYKISQAENKNTLNQHILMKEERTGKCVEITRSSLDPQCYEASSQKLRDGSTRGAGEWSFNFNSVFKKLITQANLLANTYNPSMQEAEAS